MDGTFLSAVLNNLKVFLPFQIVRSYELGVRWTLGKNPVELQPGFRWCIWFLHTVELVSCADEVIELPIQSVITQDEKLVCYSVNIGFRVVDAVAHFCNVYDFPAATQGMAATHLAKRVREEKLADLVLDLSKLEKSLETTLTTRMKRWGTEVFSVGFTNFAEIPQQIRIFSDNGHSNQQALAALKKL